jgi:hypothetical protein
MNSRRWDGACAGFLWIRGRNLFYCLEIGIGIGIGIGIDIRR